MAALIDTSPTSEITLTLISNMGNHDYLLSESVTVIPTFGDDVVEVHTPEEILLASKDYVLTSYPHGAWGVTHALATITTPGEQNLPMYADSAANKTVLSTTLILPPTMHCRNPMQANLQIKGVNFVLLDMEQ